MYNLLLKEKLIFHFHRLINGEILKAEESLQRRIDAILTEVKLRGFDTVLFLNEVISQNPANFLYVSGTWGYGEEHSALIFDLDGRSTIVMPHWGAPKMRDKGYYDNVVPVKQEKGHQIRGIVQALEQYYSAKKICFDLSTMSAQFAFQLTKALNIKLVKESDISDHIFKMRAIKDDYEIEEIKKAIQITEEAVLELVTNSRPGMKTEVLKKKMDASMIEKGAVEFSFESSIDFALGSKPSGIIKHNDLIRVDVGCRVPSGYCSDMGRTIPISPDLEIKELLNRAIAAHKDSIKKIKEGAIAKEVLDEANRINIEYGFDPIVRCGHQIGLEAHDYTMPYAPNFGLIKEDEQPLKAGMTLTFEPLNWIKNKGFKPHFEDIVQVTKEGYTLLNQLPLDLNW
jgi:Xaa-Pro aminopeptidase